MARPSLVFVHGAYHGGWCWRSVAEPLRAQGWRVFTPTLTGLGERRHLLSNAVDVELWVSDIVNVIEAEELSETILVGHSFGGVMISGVADRIPSRIGHLVYLDAGLPRPGVPAASDIPPGIWRDRLAHALTVNGVRCFPNPPAAYFGVVDPVLASWMERRMTPMPIKAYETPLWLNHKIGNGRPATFIECTEPRLAVVERSASEARQLGWEYLTLATGHNAMMTKPTTIVDILRRIATKE